MTTQYRIDLKNSRFTVQAFSTGLLSFLGHNPTFEVRNYSGTVSFEDNLVSTIQVELVIGAASLVAASSVKPSDRREMEDRMWGDVLEASVFPTIVFQSERAATERISNGRYRVALDGALSLRGISHPHRVDAELLIFKDGIRLKGNTQLRMSNHNIQPVTALGGTIRLKDEVVLSFDLAAAAEAS